MTLKGTISLASIAQVLVALVLGLATYTHQDQLGAQRKQDAMHDAQIGRNIDRVTALENNQARLEGKLEARYDEIYRLFGQISGQLEKLDATKRTK